MAVTNKPASIVHRSLFILIIMSFGLSVLQAEHGDCLLIHGEFGGQFRNILIDGGTKSTFVKQRRSGVLKRRLLESRSHLKKISKIFPIKLNNQLTNSFIPN